VLEAVPDPRARPFPELRGGRCNANSPGLPRGPSRTRHRPVPAPWVAACKDRARQDRLRHALGACRFRHGADRPIGRNPLARSMRQHGGQIDHATLNRGRLNDRGSQVNGQINAIVC
jgi:hypothetical protein